MKKLIFVLAIFTSSLQAQTIAKLQPNGTYTAIKSNKDTLQAIETGKYFIASNGENLPIFQTTKGMYFVNRISKKSGKSYKQYLKLENN